MSAHDNSAGQHPSPAVMVAEVERESARVAVDLRLASSRLNQIEAPVSRALPDGSRDETFSIDVSGILEILRRLPANAGTAAFVAAYNAAHPDFHRPTL